MATPWRDSPRRRALLGALSVVGGAAFAIARLLRGRARDVPPLAPRRILVIEPWQIGDNVITAAALAAVREAFPEAHVALLAQPHAEVLLRHTRLADEIIPFTFPWTAFAGKYDLRRYSLRAFLGLVRRLRAARFDLTIDARADARQNVVAWLSGAPRRLGFDFGGGEFLLTDRAPAGAVDAHKLEDWLALLRFAGRPARAVAPRLVPSPEESRAARATLAAHGIAPDDLVVGVHPGASHPLKRWDPAHFARVADELAARRGARIVVFVDPEGCGEHLPLAAPAAFVRPSLRELLALQGECDVVLCNDSGPMHMAAAVGVPVVALFTTGDPRHFAPLGDGHRVVARHDLTCRPCFNACTLAAPICADGLTPERVLAEVDAVLGATLARGEASRPPAGPPNLSVR